MSSFYGEIDPGSGEGFKSEIHPAVSGTKYPKADFNIFVGT